MGKIKKIKFETPSYPQFNNPSTLYVEETQRPLDLIVKQSKLKVKEHK